MRADSGDATIGGNSVFGDVSKIQNLIGVCSQHDIFYPSMTAFQQIDLIAKFCGIQSGMSSREYAKSLLSKVGLENEIDKRISQFSGGMKRRFSLILASIGERPILFLDEPTTGLVIFIKLTN